jgi:hypothetical protein
MKVISLASRDLRVCQDKRVTFPETLGFSSYAVAKSANLSLMGSVCSAYEKDDNSLDDDPSNRAFFDR